MKLLRQGITYFESIWKTGKVNNVMLNTSEFQILVYPVTKAKSKAKVEKYSFFMGLHCFYKFELIDFKKKLLSLMICRGVSVLVDSVHRTYCLSCALLNKRYLHLVALRKIMSRSLRQYKTNLTV